MLLRRWLIISTEFFKSIRFRSLRFYARSLQLLHMSEGNTKSPLFLSSHAFRDLTFQEKRKRLLEVIWYNLEVESSYPYRKPNASYCVPSQSVLDGGGRRSKIVLAIIRMAFLERITKVLAGEWKMIEWNVVADREVFKHTTDGATWLHRQVFSAIVVWNFGVIELKGYTFTCKQTLPLLQSSLARICEGHIKSEHSLKHLTLSSNCIYFHR